MGNDIGKWIDDMIGFGGEIWIRGVKEQLERVEGCGGLRGFCRICFIWWWERYNYYEWYTGRTNLDVSMHNTNVCMYVYKVND